MDLFCDGQGIGTDIKQISATKEELKEVDVVIDLIYRDWLNLGTEVKEDQKQ